MKKIFYVAALLVAISATAPLLVAHTVSAQPNNGKALVLSSLQSYTAMYYADSVQFYLQKAGYNVTFLTDRAVTINLLLNQLKNYDVVIWRTNIYIWQHITYWYVGELDNPTTRQAYSYPFSQGWIDNTNGILGVSAAFFQNEFGPGSLSHVKLFIIEGSESTTIGTMLLTAGVQAVIAYYGDISLYYGDMDYVTNLVIRNLADGKTVDATMYNVQRWYMGTQPVQNLGSEASMPPVWYLGNGNLTID